MDVCCIVEVALYQWPCPFKVLNCDPQGAGLHTAYIIACCWLQMKISCSQRLVAYTLETFPGSEQYTAHIQDIATGDDSSWCL